ncbi:hypothetical protein ACFL5V_07505 [Fibrobacterota bacterium]
MISESLIIMILVSLVFLSGTYVGQLIFKIRLAKLEKENLMLGQKRMSDLKNLLSTKSHSSGRRKKHHSSSAMDRAVRDEIDDILGEIEGKK